MAEIPEDIMDAAYNVASGISYVVIDPVADRLAIAEAIFAERLKHTPPPLPHVMATPADQIIGQIEDLFPNWRSYRDLVDCITCELHELRKRAEGRL